MTTPGRPDEMLDHPIPDLTLPDPSGRPYPLRARVGVGPQVFFFYVRNATPS